MTASVLIIIPCLNEARCIGALLQHLAPDAAALRAKIIVADGGSTDGTREIVRREMQRNPDVILLDNPARLQSAAVNLAVARYGDGVDYLIRIDAHGAYPADYCRALFAEITATGADSIVVPMRTEGRGLFQCATALAQNSKLGTGGSKHRMGSQGEWVDHGHHALMRIAAFRAVGGYDESFSHNEDAELDHRLTCAGYRIWLTGQTRMIYYPRDTAKGLWRQYFGYGKGRASTLLKHHMRPKLRQMLPLFVAPAAVLALSAPLWPLAALPFLAWAGLCLVLSFQLALQQRRAGAALAALPAMIMHLAWSAGFWRRLLLSRK